MSAYENDDQGPDIPTLREAAKRGESAAKERDEALRKLALVEAGVDTKSPVGKLFTTAYTGDLTEDAIKAAWSEVAPATTVVPPETPPATEPTPPTPTAEGKDETQQRRLLTSTGASDIPPETPPEDPVARGYDEFHQRMKDGESRIAAAGSVFGSLLKGASEGDERAMWNGWTEEQLEKGRGH